MSGTSDTNSNTARLAVYCHPACEEHDIPSHPEQPHRVSSILYALQENFPEASFREANRATDEQILLAHHTPLLQSLQSKFALTNNAKASNRETIYENIDGDTVIMFASEEAIYRAAGASVQAVDDLYQGSSSSGSLEQENKQSDDSSSVDVGFCCVRPPGHHAEPFRSMGFCFVNNAVIAAEHARLRYGVQRVAILDFDVHHGNGTNEYARLLYYHYKKQQDEQQETTRNATKTVFSGGFGASKFPVSEAERVYASHDFVQFEEILENQQKYRAKCRDHRDDEHINNNNNDSNDANNDTNNNNNNNNDNNNKVTKSQKHHLYPLFYASTHERQGFPGTGAEVPLEKRTDIDRVIVNRNIPCGPKSRTKFREKWCEIIEELLVYDPELVIFSAGFDAHDDDPLADVELQDDDFYWVTRTVLDRLNEAGDYCRRRPAPAKVLSVLEGGYDLDAIARCAVEHVQAMLDAFDNASNETKNEDIPSLVEERNEEKEPVVVDGGKEENNIDIETVLSGGASHGGDEVAALQEILSELGIKSPAKAN